jgi:hypothetical protein
MVEFNNKVYLATQLYNSGYIKLYEYDGASTLTEKASISRSNIDSLKLIVHNNELYLCCSYYGGPNYLYKYDGTSTFDLKVTKTNFARVHSLLSYNGSLYASMSGSDAYGKLLKYNEVDDWTSLANTLAEQAIKNLVVLNGEIYGVCGVDGECYLWKWNGVDAWISLCDGTQGVATLIASVFNGKIYACDGWNADGYLYEFDGVDTWVLKTTTSSESYVGYLFNT